MGYSDASGLGGGGVWSAPNYDGTNLLWCFKWPSDIQDNLISFENLTGGVTNSDLELVAPILHEATFPEVCKLSSWYAPLTGSNDTPNVAWTFKEIAAINPVVANLLRICSIVNPNPALTPAVFYQSSPSTLYLMMYLVALTYPTPNFYLYSLANTIYNSLPLSGQVTNTLS
jgi:hypothetical protein